MLWKCQEIPHFLVLARKFTMENYVQVDFGEVPGLDIWGRKIW
jgi:hypothetical protein